MTTLHEQPFTPISPQVLRDLAERCRDRLVMDLADKECRVDVALKRVTSLVGIVPEKNGEVK